MPTVHTDIGKSSAVFTNYSTSPPTAPGGLPPAVYTLVTENGTYRSSKIPLRARLVAVEVFVTPIAPAVDVTETSITAYISRTDVGVWTLAVIDIPLVNVGGLKVSGYAKLDPDRIYIHNGLTEEVAFDQDAPGTELYAFIYGAVGGHDCRVDLIWEKLSS